MKPLILAIGGGAFATCVVFAILPSKEQREREAEVRLAVPQETSVANTSLGSLLEPVQIALYREPVELAPEPDQPADRTIESGGDSPDLDEALQPYVNEVWRLERRVAWLETELVLCGSEAETNTVGRWYQSLRLEERPSAKTLRIMSEMLVPYPVEMTAEEGLWIVDRIEKDDWKGYGPTVDEALILFLGSARIETAVTPVQLAELRKEWSEEGYFKP